MPALRYSHFISELLSFCPSFVFLPVCFRCVSLFLQKAVLACLLVLADFDRVC